MLRKFIYRRYNIFFIIFGEMVQLLMKCRLIQYISQLFDVWQK